MDNSSAGGEQGHGAADHEALKESATWSTLQFIGLQPDFDDDGKDAALELRNCTCGTTLAKPARKAA